jgi:hypothetical protein
VEELRLFQQARIRNKGSDLTVETTEIKAPKENEPTTFQSLGENFTKHVDLPDSLEMKMFVFVFLNLLLKHYMRE